MSQTIPLPPHEFSLMPFWFWNDQLDEQELLRQIDDFAAHGVHGFVIHPRMGLPTSLGWMGAELLRFMAIAIEAAAKRDMRVILYDEGMYPSGSSSGQVAAEDPRLACRCLALLEAGAALPSDANLITQFTRPGGERFAVIDRPANSYIRGLHYLDEDKNIEVEPLAGDILNPRTAAAVLRLVYQKFYDAFSNHFGKTILGIFTDEPNPLGKSRDPKQRPGTTGILQDVSRRLGYDFTPYLSALWFDEPGAEKYRADYDWALRRRLEETWYQPLSRWCQDHGVALCGHPDRGDEIGVQKYFHFPGQDLVWRWVLPGHASALEGPESTQAKCSSSAMIHYGRRRNSNEFCGAYGHETTFDEFQWLANWCLVRGVNLLIPHAFYYSVRGPRRDERPPQVGGVGCSWWADFKPFADHCRLISWLNTDSKHHCRIAILTAPDQCPWKAAKVCFENQRDFNYLDVTPLDSPDVSIDAAGLHIHGMCYEVLIYEDIAILSPTSLQRLRPMIDCGAVINFSTASAELIPLLDDRIRPSIATSAACPDLRIRLVEKDAAFWVLLFNEGSETIATELSINWPSDVRAIERIDMVTRFAAPSTTPISLRLDSHDAVLFRAPRQST